MLSHPFQSLCQRLRPTHSENSFWTQERCKAATLIKEYLPMETVGKYPLLTMPTMTPRGNPVISEKRCRLTNGEALLDNGRVTTGEEVSTIEPIIGFQHKSKNNQ
jgi:hypothetical protein